LININQTGQVKDKMENNDFYEKLVDEKDLGNLLESDEKSLQVRNLEKEVIDSNLIPNMSNEKLVSYFLDCINTDDSCARVSYLLNKIERINFDFEEFSGNGFYGIRDCFSNYLSRMMAINKKEYFDIGDKVKVLSKFRKDNWTFPTEVDGIKRSIRYDVYARDYRNAAFPVGSIGHIIRIEASNIHVEFGFTPNFEWDKDSMILLKDKNYLDEENKTSKGLYSPEELSFVPLNILERGGLEVKFANFLNKNEK